MCQKTKEIPIVPVTYQTYYCVHCGNKLVSPFDFDCHNEFHGTQKHKDIVLFASYHCSSCDIVARNPLFDSRQHTPLALPFLARILKNHELPIHVRQAYQRQYNAILKGDMYLSGIDNEI